jgi:uncharacterized protein YjlB
MGMIPQKFYFKDDGITPNNIIPVLLFRNIGTGEGNVLAFFYETFSKNGWGNNWQDIINTADHYHSTTHEVLGIAQGEIKLQLGGENGIQILVQAGDVLLIPAGVGHYALEDHRNYLVVGGYPESAEWDMIFNDPEQYTIAKERIKNLPMYKKLPI